ncbi:uncharacterized protein ASPGLDRAFT_41831 [Aspergillus glaucus CBS 516.65]|uniref:Uncharacterized protein n=1 Tax=Aspergillus glaucus CBS 516.65 TaxID=1160497 RepID=A0A1L9VWL6_ASPGL|nr:hypothetical protein ASPGLDRAFT_41831 [Aspergillus glaucus CBS 516.65]OJJ88287.1 hypothetical protein ASPGLDRAFT_41831 [Aspergillus glaucus CBS 516.65]
MNTLEHAPIAIHTNHGILYPQTISAVILGSVYIWTELYSVWSTPYDLVHAVESWIFQFECVTWTETRSTFYILLVDETWNSWPLLCGICPSSSVHEIPTMPPKRPKWPLDSIICRNALRSVLYSAVIAQLSGCIETPSACHSEYHLRPLSIDTFMTAQRDRSPELVVG